MPRQFILMGDVIKSSDYEAQSLNRQFHSLISSCNQKLTEHIISPYTITLGDEFQGIAHSLSAVVETLFYLEETALWRGLNFKLRFVALHGEIETPVNRLKAHGMMGEGLKRARQILTHKRRAKPRFVFQLVDEYTMNQLNRLFIVFEGLTDRWEIGDARIILDMLANPHNREVGSKHGKNRTQIWKRRRRLLIEEYRALKEAILEISNTYFLIGNLLSIWLAMIGSIITNSLWMK